MGLQPIDLQTMYSQLSNVARDAASVNQAQLSEGMHQVDVVKRNQEETKKVQNAQKNSQSTQINKDGKNSGYGYSSPEKKGTPVQDESSGETEQTKKNPLESYLGKHIDITR